MALVWCGVGAVCAVWALWWAVGGRATGGLQTSKPSKAGVGSDGGGGDGGGDGLGGGGDGRGGGGDGRGGGGDGGGGGAEGLHCWRRAASSA